MTGTTINQSFEYLAEESKLNFQGHIGSLIEFKIYLSEKSAKANNKEAVFFSEHELQVLDKWLVDIYQGLQTDYEIIHRTNKLQNVNYESLRRLLTGRSPNLKSLAQ